MTVLEVGQKLVSLCREGKLSEMIDQLYAGDVVSVEARAFGPFPRRVQGKDKVQEKNRFWLENNELHSIEVEGPFPHDDQFIVLFRMEATNRESGCRVRFSSTGLYTVAKGKISQEKFFYHLP